MFVTQSNNVSSRREDNIFSYYYFEYITEKIKIYFLLDDLQIKMTVEWSRHPRRSERTRTFRFVISYFFARPSAPHYP